MKYSVPDIDRMRAALDRGWRPNPYNRDEWALLRERQLVTYMMNGTTAEELEARAEERERMQWDQQDAEQEGKG